MAPYTFRAKTYDFSERTHIMGILNVTPDSFFDGGKYQSPDQAVERALAMVAEGADIIDVGGESTRPQGAAYGAGADPVTPEEELRRVLPVIERLARATDIPISVDTTKASVASAALEAGAAIVNDISGFTFDSGMPAAVAAGSGSAIIMHIRGTPKTMQQDPVYQDLFGEIVAYLRQGLDEGRRAGIGQILVDPGIGFGKSREDNLRVIGGLEHLQCLGVPIVTGPSRKSFIGGLLNLPVQERLEGSLAAVVACILHGAHVVRVHDVKEAKRAALIADAIHATVV